MSDDGSSTSLLPSSSAAFALTLDQNVSREVRQRVITLEQQTRNAGVVSWVVLAAAVVGNVALIAFEPATVFFGVYGAIFGGTVPTAMWWYRRKASLAASELNQNRDVAFVGKDGLVFFADDGFFVEKQGGWKPWGVREPTPKRYDRVEHFADSGVLAVSSSAGYAVSIRVSRGWTARDTARVQEKLDAFRW